MCGTKCLNAFLDYTFVQPGSISCCFLWVRYWLMARPACTVAKAADIQWRKVQWHICAKWRQWQRWCVRPFYNLCIIYRHNFYESWNIKKL